MAVKISPVLNEQQFSDAGVLLSGGKIETYLAGSSTPAATYTTSAGTIAQANPIFLNTRGEVDNTIYLTTGILYKLVLKDNVGNVLRTFDNIEGVNDNSSSIDQWINSGVTPTFINATQFSLSGDQTTAFHVNRRVKLLVTAGTVYGYISASSYGALTTVTVNLDSGVLDSGLSNVQLGLITYINSSLPKVRTSQLEFDTGALGYRNKIIGGDFTTNPWQRGTSFPAAASYTADRWVISNNTTAVSTISKLADAPTAAQAGVFTEHSLNSNITTADSLIAAGDFFGLAQSIEGLNAASFGFGQTGSRFVTLSFWVKGAKTGVHCVSLRNGANNRSYIAEYTISVINTWEFKSITLPVDITGTWLYDNGVGISLFFTLAAGTTFQTTAKTWAAGNFLATANQVNELDTVGNQFKIALVQLEAGSTATAFESRSVGQELALSRRYLIRSITGGSLYPPIGGATNTRRIFISFPEQMRAVPTITGLSVSNIATPAASATVSGIAISGDPASDVECVVQDFIATAEL